MRALVVFGDGEQQHWLGPLLKPGFRHCFVCIDSKGLWIKIDFGVGIPIIEYLTTSDFDLAQYYCSQGLVVVETNQESRTVTGLWALMDCVGLVKQILCIRGFALTPYALYKQLRK